MKKPRSFILAALGTAALAGLLPAQGVAQAPAPLPANEGEAIAVLTAEIAKQQAAIVENQKQIDAKLAIIAENLRIARIYVARGGGAPAK